MSEIHLNHLIAGFVADVGEDVVVRGIESDSRCVKQGDVFVAYPGLTVDGRDYIQDAIAKGAAAIIYEMREDKSISSNGAVPFIPVSNLQHQLGNIAARFYGNPSQSMRLIGVTGTNGKTTVSQFIAQSLSHHDIRCGVMGTLGNGFLPNLQKTTHTTLDPIQFQKTLARLRDEGAKAIALEVSSHALDQGRVEAAQFDIAVLTQLSRDHLDYHGDMQRYANAKELLFQQSGLRYGVVNLDDDLGRKIAKTYQRQLKIIGYSAENMHFDVSAVVAKTIKATQQGFDIVVRSPWGEGQFSTPLLGRFNISNLLAVAAVLSLFEIPFDDVLSGLSTLRSVKGRMQRYGNLNQPQVIVDYAHTPDALQKALCALREHCAGKLYCVFGCGGDRDRGKRPEMAAIAERYADVIVMTNDNPRTEAPEKIIEDMQSGLTRSWNAKVELDRAAAIRYAVQSAGVDDIVLIAGKGHETTQTIGKTLLPFDDGKIVEETLAHYQEFKKQ
ncbi:UDP-N-acetylmuramoyl-L-alanyl-D-glutamate--2,6-diaminopimelate ligase [Candidiatus Paracoxiella cheracis]|uniref:UDP-N-acetylmuramoyl-L-alanyl-D-glutamate--2, 6-diaminopimelate ligase n=1 Tax=Candidiatus Paracoxiella cheracis TaxID=3405120 RepID=UPI003BF485C7